MAVQPLKKEPSPEIIIFSHNLMKNSPVFFKFSQDLYYMMLEHNPVTVCHKSGPVHIQKSKRWPPVRLSKNEQVQKIINQSDGQVQKILSPIFFKFWQELYYIMLKQISVTICHNLCPSHYSKVSRKWFHQFGQPPSLFLLYWTKSSDCSSRRHYCMIWTLNGAFWIF